MEDVQGFYSVHSRWLESHYFGSVDDYRRAYASLLDIFAHKERVVRVLELGCGGGQAVAATAELGERFHVTGIEIDPDLANHATNLAADERRANVRVLNADFYTVELDEQFDIVCYWDEFGIGTDSEQRGLLGRISEWLTRDGVALIDVISMTNAISKRGTSVEAMPGLVTRTYDYDDVTSRLVDIWSTERQAITQSLRCYNPEDFRLLTTGTGLTFDQALAPYVFGRQVRDVTANDLQNQGSWLACLRRSGW